MGISQLAPALLSAEEEFAPLFLADHVAAIASWVGFYVIEAVAIGAVLRTYAGNKAGAVSRAGAWFWAAGGPLHMACGT